MFVTYPDVRYLSACAPVRHPMGPTQTPAASGIATASAPLRASPPAPLRASPPAPLRASSPAPLRASPPGEPQPRPPSKSHVIRSAILQLLKSHARNCNVFAHNQKLTELNYVRGLWGTRDVRVTQERHKRDTRETQERHQRGVRSARAPDPSPQSDPARPPGRPRGAGACRALHPRHPRASSGS